MMQLFFFLSCMFQIDCVEDSSLYIKTFSAVWEDNDAGVAPFIFSSGVLSFLKKGTLQSVIGHNRSNLYLPLWQRYVAAYKPLHEWYFKIHPYRKEELYKRAPKKGRGIIIGCLDMGRGIINKDYQYEIHPALQENCVELPLGYYNSLEDLVHTLFYHIKVPVSIWCSQFRFLEEYLYKAIIEYLHTSSIKSFIDFVRVYGKDSLFTSSVHNEFSNEGHYLIEKLKKMLKCIIPVAYNGTLVPQDTLGYAYKETERVPLYQANHGNEIMGIMVGKSDDYEGVAPHAQCVMAKVFLKDARCTAQTFLEGLLMMIKHKIGLVCMSLQIPEDALSDDMRTIITYIMSIIPYTVAPSGNDSRTKEYVSFPGSVARFSVGSFLYKPNDGDNTYPIAGSSQYKKNEGPLYVMPGSAFLMPYTSRNNIKIDHNYIVSHGTSFAAAFMTGLLALFLAEINDCNFTHKEILTVLYSSGLFLQKTNDWKTKSILGTLDISKAIFIVLVLHAVKCESTEMCYLCEKYFDECVGIMHVLLQEASSMVHCYSNNNITIFKNIICSLLTQDEKCKKIISQHAYSACNNLLFGIEKKDIFSHDVTCAIDTYSYKVSSFDYDLFVRVCGVYETERIREYVESYIRYYWK